MGSTLHLSAPISPVEERGDPRKAVRTECRDSDIHVLARHFIATCKGFLVFETARAQNLDSSAMYFYVLPILHYQLLEGNSFPFPWYV